MTNFYVYILYRADGETPFYVGKGRGDRCLEHERRAARGERSHRAAIIRQIQALGLAVPKRKVAEGLSNAEACALEIKLISEIGRGPFGPLVNHTAGGDGVVDLSAEARERHRQNTRTATLLAMSYPEFRKKYETGLASMTEQQRDARRALLARYGALPEIHKRRATTMKETLRSAEHRAMMSRASRKAATAPGYKENLSATISRLRWITNGLQTSRIEGQPPEGWRFGRG